MKHKPLINPNIQLEIFDTPDKGQGLRTLCDLPKQTYLGDYFGKRYRLSRLEDFTMPSGVVMNFSLSNGFFIDGDNEKNIFRKMNHSCEPNVLVAELTFGGRMGIHFFTNRKIKAGEELCIDYLIETTECSDQTLTKLRCLCGSKLCRGTMLNLKHYTQLTT